MGLTRFELVTPRLSSVCSNQLSYRPAEAPVISTRLRACSPDWASRRATAWSILSKLDRRVLRLLSIQIDLEIRLPRLAALRPLICMTSSRKEVIQPQVLLQLPCYEARERIHRGVLIRDY